VRPYVGMHVGRRQFVVGRLLAHHILEESLLRHGGNEISVEGIRLVGIELDRATDVVLEKQEKDENKADEAFSSFLVDLPDELERKATQEHRTVAEGIAKSLKAAVEAYLDGGPDPLQETFELVAKESRRVYACAGVECSDADLRFRVRLDLAGSPHPFKSRILVGGQTVATGPTQVYLDLTAESLSTDEWRAVPYVLFHEVVVHALAHPDVIESSDGFAEGWMDLVAWQAHEQACETLFDHRAREVGASLHSARFQEPARKGGKEYRALAVRRKAKSVAIRLSGLLAEQLGDGDAGDAALIQLSVALNRAALDKRQRWLVADILSSKFERREVDDVRALLDAFLVAAAKDGAGSAGLMLAHTVLGWGGLS
jgi:hypothetical protein